MATVISTTKLTARMKRRTSGEASDLGIAKSDSARGDPSNAMRDIRKRYQVGSISRYSIVAFELKRAGDACRAISIGQQKESPDLDP